VVDVGANIGVFGVRALSLVPGGDLHYIGIEPCPQTFNLLQQNLLGSEGQGQQNSCFHINEQLGAPLQEVNGTRCCPSYPGGCHT
jgi:FkbM family methyltransferase